VTFVELADFVRRRMRMSHIYQPLMLLTLLRHGGASSSEEIAKTLLAHDQSQVEYYQQITRNMVGKVLRSHGIVRKDGDTYHLNCFDALTPEQITTLVDLCRERLEHYQAQRGDRIFEHRRKSAGYVSGTLRYDVLKRAGFHCELCGISADKKALEVDHIVPRNHGGGDDLPNLQALCFSCNAMKRDRDATDFRAVRESYAHRDDDCLFCTIPADRILLENELAYAIADGFPVTEKHCLIIPKRHAADYFALHQAEVNACNALLHTLRSKILAEDDSVTAFNVGMNNGADAGQTIFHCHIHLIPRRKNDVERPRGGVRHLIPGKGEY
jgi:diadenosine tetraphosphate (Ap4A) HIT family hydrolase/5-methylcytosine-specific restriction endonuclease McrA